MKPKFFVLNLISLFFIFLYCNVFAQNQQKESSPEELNYDKSKYEIRHGTLIPKREMNEEEHEEWRMKGFERSAKEFEPSGVGKGEDVQIYIDKYSERARYDKRMFYFDIKGTGKGSDVTLTGAVGFPEMKDSLINLLKILKLNVTDNIEVLPSKSLGDKIFAITNVSHQLIYDKPSDKSEQMTDAVIGDLIYLLKYDEPSGFYLCMSSSGYLGWIPKDALTLLNKEQFKSFQDAPKAVFKKIFKTEKVTIAIGAKLKTVKIDDKNVEVAIPPYTSDGKFDTVRVDKSFVNIFGDKSSQLIKDIIKSAEELLETPYVWGGMTQDGIDCSGYIMSVYGAFGINLSRDSNQQVESGELVATRWYLDGLKPGDAIYFTGHSGNINHTGLYIGNRRILNATHPKVQISSFDPNDKEYYNEHLVNSFAFGKRFIVW